MPPRGKTLGLNQPPRPAVLDHATVVRDQMSFADRCIPLPPTLTTRLYRGSATNTPRAYSHGGRSKSRRRFTLLVRRDDALGLASIRQPHSRFHKVKHNTGRSYTAA